MAGERRILRDDSALLAAAHSGDAEAFGDLYRRYLGDVRAFCARRVGDPIRAEDLAQDTFVKAFVQIGTFRTGAAFWPWLSTIARNLCIDENRRRRRIAEEATEELPESAETAVVSPDPTPEAAIDRDTRNRIRAAIASAMAHLSPRERRLIIRSAVNREAWSEIALAEHSSLDAVRNAAWRARAVLRSLLVDPLRDLRAWIGASIATLACRRHRRPDHGTNGSHASMLYEQVGELVRALTRASTSFIHATPAFSGEAEAVSERLDDPPVSAGSPTQAREPTSRSASPPRDLVVQSDGPEARLAAISTRSTFRERAAGPARANPGIVVRGPDGGVVYWEETSFACGDGTTIGLLPASSPIQAYC